MKRHALSLLFLTAYAVVGAQSPLPFGFAPPELTLADYNAKDLHAGDLNQDGRVDLVYLNPDRGRIDLLLQQEEGAPAPEAPSLHRDRWQPVLSHPRFQTESLIPDNPPNALSVGDFNLDGHPDLALTNDQNELQIYLGPLKSDWQPDTRLDLEPAPGSSGRMVWDADSSNLTLMRKDHLQEVSWDKKRKKFTLKTVGAPPPGANPDDLLFLDVNGDGLKDLLYELRDKRFSLAVHLRNKDGLGQLLRPVMDPQVSLVVPAPGKEPSLLGLHARSGTLLHFTFQTDTDNSEAWDSPDLEAVQLPRIPNLLPHWTDLNGDREDELLLISSSRAEILHLASGNSSASQEPITYPLPVPADWILEGKFLSDGDTFFLIHDGESGYLGLTHYAKDRLQTPLQIPNTDNILAAAAWPSDKGQDHVVAIVRNEDRSYSFKHWSLEQNDQDVVSLTLHQELELPEVKRNIGQLLTLEPPEAPVRTLVATSPLGEAFFLQPDDEGAFSLQPTAPGFSKTLLERLSTKDIWLAPPETPLPTRWVLYKQNRVHFLKLGRNGMVEVEEQINLSSTSEPQGVVPLDAKGSELAILTGNGRRLEIHERLDNGLYQYKRDAELPPLQPSHTQLFKLKDNRYGLRILGRQELAVLIPQAPKLQTTSRSLYETDIPDTYPDRILTGDFNGDKRVDIVLIDSTHQSAIEFLDKPTEKTWTSRMHFQLFETSPGAAGRRGANQEPRETLVQDIDGDGLDDLVLLMHDRVLFYRQDPIPESK